VIGVLNIYSASVESFNKDEVSLLEELAADLSLGIEKIRRREEQRKLEEALNLSEQNFRNSLDSSIMGMRIIDTEGQTLYANQAFLDMFGYKKYYEVGRYALQDHYTPEEKARYIERMARKQRGESIPDNSKVDIYIKTAPCAASSFIPGMFCGTVSPSGSLFITILPRGSRPRKP